MEAIQVTVKQLQQLWTEASVKATMLKTAIETLSGQVPPSHDPFPINQTEGLYGLSKIKTYVPLLEMDKCPSLDEKLSAPANKKRREDEHSTI